jgi:hypothetical protein
MNVVFGAILNVAAEMVRQLFGWKGIVVNFTVDRVIFPRLVHEGLQKCTASRSGITKDDLAKFQRGGTWDKMGWDLRIISPGFTTPSNPDRISLTLGCRRLWKFAMIDMGLNSEPRAGKYDEAAVRPNAQRLQKTIPRELGLLSSPSCLNNALIEKNSW